MARVVNRASTWENHSAGSLGQYGGSLMLIAEVTGSGGAWSTELEIVAVELDCWEFSNDIVEVN